MNGVSRRTLIRSSVATAGGLVLAGCLADCSSESAPTAVESTTTTLPVTNGDEALARLLAGNSRYVAGAPVNQGRDTVRRAEEAQSQSPFAVILSCSDSRVSPEVVFDEGVGDLFVVRVAGNTCETPIVQGSIEYAIEYLHSVLLMVLGHEGCGAVKAALDSVAGSPLLLDKYRPSSSQSFRQPRRCSICRRISRWTLLYGRTSRTRRPS